MVHFVLCTDLSWYILYCILSYYGIHCIYTKLYGIQCIVHQVIMVYNVSTLSLYGIYYSRTSVARTRMARTHGIGRTHTPVPAISLYI